MGRVPPGWKVRRELVRLGRDLAALPAELARKVYFRRWYDHVTARAIRQTAGALACAPEIGLYLVFPSAGVPASSLRLLDEMRAAGIAPLVVSNLPLSPEDRAQVAARAWRVIERPNVGRDFGGYRDGILSIGPQLAGLSRLWLMNDSIWMVPGGGRWFAEARELGADLVAATEHYAQPRTDPARFRDIVWAPSSSQPRFHYGSYALGVGNRILRDPAFLRFWRHLDIRNDKTRTVRRGEIGLSQWVLRRGFSHRATGTIDALEREIAGLPVAALDDLARRLVILENPRLASLRRDVIAGDPTTDRGREDRIRLILAAVAREGRAYVLPAHDLPRGFPFIKKSPLRLSREAAACLMTVMVENRARVGEEILREARGLLRADAVSALAGQLAPVGPSGSEPRNQRPAPGMSRAGGVAPVAGPGVTTG